jgi:hypothetical protein
MTKINLITPPDKLHNKAISFLLVWPKNEILEQFQNLVINWTQTINLYLYSPEEEVDYDVSWVLDISKQVDYVILDLDNMDSQTKNFASYLISYPNVFYLTNDELTPYNLLSTNRIFNLDWIQHSEE